MSRIIRNIMLLLISVSGTFLMGQNQFSLDEAIDYALKHSPELQKSAIAQMDADAQISEYKSIGLPKVKGTLSYQYYIATPSQPVEDFITPSIYGVLFQENVIPKKDLGTPETFKFSFFQPNQLTAGIEVNSMLFDNTYIYGLKAAKLLKEVAAKQTAVTEYNVKDKVVKAYLSVLIAQENVSNLQENLKNIEKSMHETKATFNQGFAEMLDVERLELSVENLKSEIGNISNMADISKRLLKFSMNFDSDEDIILTDDLNKTMNYLNTNISKDIVATAQARPELALFELNESLDALDVKRTKSGYLPTLNGFASASGSLMRQNLFDNSETGVIPQAVVGVSMNLPIYDGGDRKAKLQRIKLRQQTNSLEKSEFVRGVKMQVENARAGWINAKQTLEYRRKSLDTAKSIYDKTLIKYKEGVGSSIEVIQSESMFLQAQSQYTNALYDVISAGFEVKTSLGTL
ncbi:MAG: TolC family protein [Saprospiraceae bacterium]